MKTNKNFFCKNKIFFVYLILFLISFFVTFYIFIKNNISFVWNNDGVNQHFAILYDFNENIRQIKEKGFSTFQLNIGLGLDLIGQYTYYVLGDPFALISLLFPMDKLNYAYSLMVLLRMFLAGVAFIAFCRYKKKRDIPTLIGAIAYAFCGFSIYAGIRHPYFLNAMILLPIILIGFEKLIRENKKILFIISIFLSSVVNYYFFYMLTIILAIYASVIYFYDYRKKGIKYFFRTLLKVAGCYLIGILLSGIVLVPTIHAFLNSARSDTETVTVTRFSGTYYQNFLMNHLNINGTSWMVIGLTSLFIPLLSVAFMNIKNNKKTITIFIIMIIMLLVPQIASIMNGFSYPTDRWIFGYIFIICYIMTCNYKEQFEYNKKEILVMILYTSIYINLSYMILKYNKADYSNFKLNIIFAGIFILIILLSTIYKNKIKKQHIIKEISFIVIIFMIFNIRINSSYLLEEKGDNYSSEFVKFSDNYIIYANEKNKIGNFKDAIQYLKDIDNSIYRIAKYPIGIHNTSIVYNYNGISGYYSIGNNGVYNFADELELVGYCQTRPLTDLNNRTQLLNLLNTKYYICDEENEKYLPYGYKLIKKLGETKIYLNENYLPIGIFYNNYINDKEYDSLNSIEKQNSMMNFAKIEEENELEDYRIEKGNVNNLKSIYNEANYTIIDEKNILKDNYIETEKGKNIIELQLEEKIEGELYVIFENINYSTKSKVGSTKYTLKVENSGKSVSETMQDTKNAYYIKKDNLTFNLGDNDIKDKKIKITIDTASKGKFTYENIKVISIPYNKIDEQVEKIRKTEFTNIQYLNYKITGNINNKEEGILQLSIPFSDGWKCYVDGKEIETLRVNTAFIGIPLNSGEHNVEFVYHTPWLKAGIICSGIGIISLITIIILEKKERKIKKTKEKKC